MGGREHRAAVLREGRQDHADEHRRRREDRGDARLLHENRGGHSGAVTQSKSKSNSNNKNNMYQHHTLASRRAGISQQANKQNDTIPGTESLASRRGFSMRD